MTTGGGAAVLQKPNGFASQRAQIAWPQFYQLRRVRCISDFEFANSLAMIFPRIWHPKPVIPLSSNLSLGILTYE